jgi:hypothetical protein
MTPAPFPILWLLRFVGHWAVTFPWGTIYCVPEQLDNLKLLAHEQVHLEQIKRDGAILWTLKTWYYYFRYGYQNSPYEVEARQLSGI